MVNTWNMTDMVSGESRWEPSVLFQGLSLALASTQTSSSRGTRVAAKFWTASAESRPSPTAGPGSISGLKCIHQLRHSLFCIIFIPTPSLYLGCIPESKGGPWSWFGPRMLINLHPNLAVGQLFPAEIQRCEPAFSTRIKPSFSRDKNIIIHCWSLINDCLKKTSKP